MNDLEQLKAQIEEFKAWKAEKEKQQFVYPLDITSRKVLQKNMLVATGVTVTPVSLLASPVAMEVKLGDSSFWILAAPAP